MTIKPLQRSATLAGCILLAAFGAHAAGDFTVQNGTWIVTSEVDGNPGRGMAIDVQDGILVMQVYNYESSGQPTFHLSFGAMTGNQYSGTLTRYRNGRYYGSGPLDGVEDAVVGNVSINFDSAATGTIQFPGEAPVAISRFNFDMIPTGSIMRTDIVSERWLMAELDGTNQPMNALLVDTGTMVFSPSPQIYPALSSVQSFKDGNTIGLTPCTYNGTTTRFTCDIQFDGSPTKRTLEWSKHLESMSGRISGTSACTFSPCPPEWRRVVGMRLGLNLATGTSPTHGGGDAQMDAPSAAMTPPAFTVTPDPGTWIVSSEATGKPGRGMAIDVQYDTLVMQVYNYEKSGAPTFHLAVAPYAHNEANGHLKRYEGGRYFGGPALSGHEVADVGAVQYRFSSPTQGTIQFPGESPVAMHRYQFGATAPSPESLFGGWMIFDPTNHRFTYYNLNATHPAYPSNATGSGGWIMVRCGYVEDADESVVCDDKSATVSDTYRFTPVNGRAVGTYTGNAGSTGTPIYVLRVKDRHGTLADLGKF